MAFKDIGLLKDRGHAIPGEFLEAVVPEHQSAFGYTLEIDGKLYRDVQISGMPAAGATKMTEQFKEAPALLHIVHSTNAVLKEDVQPAVLLQDGEEQPLMVALVQGNFKEYEQPATPYSGSFWFVEKRLRPKMMKLYKAASMDMEAFLADINADDNVTMNELLDMVPPDSSVVLMACDGQVLALNNPPTREQTHDWGAAYGLATAESEIELPKEPEKELSVLEKARLAMAGGKTATEAVKEAKAALPPAVGKAPVAPPIAKKDTKPEIPLARNKDNSSFIEASGVMITPPADRDDKEKLQAWYTNHIGYIPSNWKQRPMVSGQPVPKADPKATTAMPAGVHAVPTKKAAEPLPLLSKQEREEITGTYLPKVRGYNGDYISNPALANAEMKEPGLSNQLGETGVKDYFMGSKARYQTCVEYPQLAQLIWRDVQVYALNLEKALEITNNKLVSAEAERTALLAKIEKLEKTEPPFTPDEKKTETPAMPAPAAPPAPRPSSMPAGVRKRA